MSDTEIKYDTALIFGTPEDRVIETVGRTFNGKAFELGYYNGADKKKAIINISPATGCPVGCNFCDLTDSGGPLSAELMHQQVVDMANLATQVDGENFTGKPLKINYAKTGEPVLNPYVVQSMHMIAESFPGVSFKYSTSLPDTPKTLQRVNELAFFAAGYIQGSVQLQISLISTSDEFRQASVGTKSNIQLLPMTEVANLVNQWHKTNPRGRVPNCSFVVASDTPCDPTDIIDTFRTGNIRFRIRPVVDTEHSLSHGLERVNTKFIEETLSAFNSYGYDISTDGISTETEMQHTLASNVTRNRILQGQYPQGVWYVNENKALEPTDYRI